ncbi:hypothetical protein [Thalassotalea litorea]|uniref:hypothetical protein n=1 Tax=Thalassotalea litorea TaxID=2020715 RepID=UPI003734F2A2
MKFKRLFRPISSNIKDEREVIFLELIVTFICIGFAFIAKDAQLVMLYYPMIILAGSCIISACYHIILLYQSH